MSASVLLITHDGVGEDLMETATRMLGRAPLTVRALAVSQDTEPESILMRARELADTLNGGDGLLVLTDAYGSTPSNIATRLGEDRRVAVVAGVNLPMLIRIFNYPELPLEELADAAVDAGRIGVMRCPGDRGGA